MSRSNLTPTVEEIKKVLWYDKESGLFLARFAARNYKPWRQIGSIESKGYLQIKVGKNFTWRKGLLGNMSLEMIPAIFK